MQETTPSTETVVPIYVRLGRSGYDQDDSVREISFRIPEGIELMELLDKGFAIDGRNAGFTIAWDRNAEVWDAPFGIIAPTMNRALADTQRSLVGYLREKGFTPQFA